MSRKIVVDDPAITHLLPRVRRAATLDHSGRSFLEHLLCTWRILVDWNMPVAVCRAGFMHSAYSTSFYPHALFSLDQRDLLKRAIGCEAEDLVFRFCTMDRGAFWNELASAQRVRKRSLINLLMIESANIAEQSRAEDRGPAPWMSRVLGWWALLDARSVPVRLKARPALIAASDQRAIDAYRRALRAPAVRARSWLDLAIEQNPWVGEPRILRALCISKGYSADAVAEARHGGELMSAWAVAWDKRLSSKAWHALASRIASRSHTARLDFESVREMLNDRAPPPRWLKV
jgi:hypothetical protein